MADKTLSEILSDIFDRLLQKYGPQHWWPARGHFEVIIGAILTQSTAWTNVEKAIANLKAAGKLSPGALRRLSEAELAGLIHPCGYYRVKARRVQAFVGWLGEYFNDSLEKLFTNDAGTLRERLLAIHGIGEETADSILLYAGNKPVFVVDAYTRRIIDRMGLTPARHDYTGYQKLFTSNLPENVKLFNEFHALLVCHGKVVCRKQPLCQRCCLNRKQKSRRSESDGVYPCAGK
jgi:endonuclease-3 related protein